MASAPVQVPPRRSKDRRPLPRDVRPRVLRLAISTPSGSGRPGAASAIALLVCSEIEGHQPDALIVRR